MKRPQLNLNLNSVILFIAVGVLLPVLLSTAAGIVAIVFAKNVGGIVTGALVISFTLTAAGFGLVAVLLAGKKARLARRQADFVANVSHEFRTPLSAIRLYTQTLQSGRLAGDPAQVARCLATVLRETEWLDAMVDRVLLWRASARDMLALVLSTGPVSGAVLEAVKRFRAMVSEEGLTLECCVDSRKPVRHDGKAINSVVLNLLTNAYKYTGPDKRIRVRVQDEADWVVIEVCDNGIGIAAGEQRHLFEPFYRGAGGADVGGVGLGLAIVHDLVGRHGGSVSVFSEKGAGARFAVRLPVAEELP